MDEYLAQFFNPMREKLSQTVGQQVLVVVEEPKSSGCNMGVGPDPPPYTARTQLLGLLKEPPFIDEKKGFDGAVIVPTGAHVEREGGWLHDWRLVQQDIQFNTFQLPHLDRSEETHRRRALREEARSSLSVYAGEEVERYFAPIRPGSREPDLDITYVDGLKMLGLQPPERFRGKYEAARHGEKIRIVDQLERFMAEEARLSGKVRRVFDATKKGVFEDGGAITVVEDEDDATIVTMGMRSKIKEHHSEITRTLRRALQFGMDRHPLELTLGQPGIKVDVPLYITNLCATYGVKRDQ